MQWEAPKKSSALTSTRKVCLMKQKSPVRQNNLVGKVAWVFYDWANSVFATTVMAGFFPIVLSDYWSLNADGTKASDVLTTQRLGFVLSLSGFILAFSSPFLGAMADRLKKKKEFLSAFALLGILATFFLAYVGKGQWQEALVLYGLAFLGFSGSTLFYDSLLPWVAKPHEYSWVSSLGFSMGYLGGGLMLLFNSLMLANPQRFGMAGPMEVVSLAFILVSLWWLVFSLPLMFFVRENNSDKEPKSANDKAANLRVTREPLLKILRLAFLEVRSTLFKIKKHPNLWIFILAYCLYMDGVNTIIHMAVLFGKNMNLPSSSLIQALLLVQFVGFPMALCFAWLTRFFSEKNLIFFCLGVYVLVSVLASQMTKAEEFFLLAALVGLVQGGVQALSRSFFAKMIPKENSAEYFGFFNLVGRFASIIGPLLVGLFAGLAGESRYGILGIVVLLLFGALLLAQVKPAKN